MCDAGSRDSLFPSFLAWRGFRVTCVDPDSSFVKFQQSASKNWGVALETNIADIAHAAPGPVFDAVTCLFSLQHAADDVAAYRRIPGMLASGGTVLTVNEYRHDGTAWHRGRPDGDMRIYGTEDFAEHVERRLYRRGAYHCGKDVRPAREGPRRSVRRTRNPEEANLVFLAAKKK